MSINKPILQINKSFIFLISLLLITFSAFNQAVDSKSDKYNSLQTKIEKNISEDPEKALQYIQLYEEWAVEDDFVDKQAQAHLFLGDYYYYQQDLIKSTRNYELAANIAISAPGNLDSIYCFAKVYMAYNYNEMNLYDKSLDVLFDGIQYARSMKDQSFLADYYSIISGAYFYKGSHDLALIYVDSCLTLEKELKDTSGIIKALNNYGKINEKVGYFEQALVYYEESLRLQNISPTENNVFSVLTSNIGDLYQKLGNTDKALKKYQDALELSTEEADTSSIISNYLNIGQIKSLGGNNLEAISYYKNAESLLDTNSLNPKAFGSQKIAVFNHLSKALIQQGEYEIAKRYLKQSLVISKEFNLKKQLRKTYLLYSDLSKIKGDYKEAFFYYKKSVAINNEIQNTETQEKIAELNSKYNFEAQLNEIDELQKENQIKELEIEKSILQKKGLILLIILFVIIALFLVIIGIKKYKKRILKKEELLLDKEKEIENLQKTISRQLEDTETRNSNTPLENINQQIKTPLTNKEYEVLRDVQKGFKNKEIADKQFISVNTVKFHLKNIYEKLGVDNRIQAIQLLKK